MKALPELAVETDSGPLFKMELVKNLKGKNCNTQGRRHGVQVAGAGEPSRLVSHHNHSVFP